MRHLWCAFVALCDALGHATRATGRGLYTGVKTLGELSGSLLVTGTFIVVVLHILHGLGAPLPDVPHFVLPPN